MTTIEESVDVRAGVSTVCDRWTRFDAFTKSEHHGEVSFQPVDEDTTRVHVRMDHQSDSVRRRIAGDLERFKSLVESDCADEQRAPRGGNSGCSIPPGTPAHDRLCGGHGDPVG